MKAGELPSKLPGGDHEEEGVESEDDVCDGDETPEEAGFYGQLAASRERGKHVCVYDRDLVCATQQDNSTAPCTYYWSGPALFDLMSSVMMTITRGAP